MSTYYQEFKSILYLFCKKRETLAHPKIYLKNNINYAGGKSGLVKREDWRYFI